MSHAKGSVAITSQYFAPRLNSLRDALMLLSFVFIGADLLSIKIGDLTIRAVTIPLVMVWMMDFIGSRCNFRIDRKIAVCFALLFLASIISFPGSYDHYRTAAYSLWLIFTFVVIFQVFYFTGKNASLRKVVGTWVLVYRLHAILLFIELTVRAISGGLGLDDELRPHLWFYEPSYAAIFLTPYFATCLYLVMNGKIWARNDLIISLLSMLILISATAMFAIFFSVAVNVVLSKNRWKLMAIFAVSASFIVGVLHLFFEDTLIHFLLVGYLFDSSNVLFSILERGGTRVIRALWGWDAFMAHPLFGIGFGADQTYTKVLDIPDIAAPFMKPIFDVSGNPFLNSFIEAGATMGVLGIISLAAIIVDFIRRFISIPVGAGDGVVTVRAFLLGFFVMFLVLQAEGTFLRFYVWSTLGLCYGILARWKMAQSANSNEYRVFGC